MLLSVVFSWVAEVDSSAVEAGEEVDVGLIVFAVLFSRFAVRENHLAGGHA